LGKLLEPRNILWLALTGLDAFKDLQHALRPNTAGWALTAGFLLSEGKEVVSNIYHARVLVHHDHSAGAHDATGRGQRLVIYWRVEHAGGDTTARWSTRLDGFDLLVIEDPAADVKYDLP
jgi:hypothetical protein